jgi:hypothetical protein
MGQRSGMSPKRAGRRAAAAVAFYSGLAAPRDALTSVGWRALVVTAASLGRAWGRRTWAGNRDRWLRGEVRSARIRCCRSGTARTCRRARTATPRHRSAQCRPPRPTREQMCWGWPPIEQLPLLSRTSGSPAGAVAFGTPRNASHYRRGTRPRRTRHGLRLGAGQREELDQGWLHPERRHRRRSCRRVRHPHPREADQGARCEDHEALPEGCRSVMWPSTTRTLSRTTRWTTPSRTRTRSTGGRGLRRSPR